MKYAYVRNPAERAKKLWRLINVQSKKRDVETELTILKALREKCGETIFIKIGATSEKLEEMRLRGRKAELCRLAKRFKNALRIEDMSKYLSNLHMQVCNLLNTGSLRKDN